MNIKWIQSLRGSSEYDFIQRAKIGKSGGQILIWDTSCYEAIDNIFFDCVIGVRGKWKSNGEILNMVNIYGPHEDNQKQQLWSKLSSMLDHSDEAWVLCEDFNEVRDQSERLSCEFLEYRSRRFNDFITSCGLIDIPLGGRAFTCVSDDGTKLRLILERTRSDHCPILLKDDDKNFRPKPFRVFDIWFNDDEAEKVIENAWNGQIRAMNRKNCNFGNHLKNVKSALKSWSENKFGKLDFEIEALKTVGNNLEIKSKTSPLSETVLQEWKESRKRWLEKEKTKSSMLKQKARLRWNLGDKNSRFFHSIIRNKQN
ncbi:uncharacterized protein [Rutidosis leptorrhynchoides]|uniref:uncharacterized protein n=1 Tax=Rutidosis leptorrhynchoides TaxID=125765 RepID=UPI003A99EC04